MPKKPTCKTGLKKNVIDRKTFEREIGLCQMLSKENKGGCGWGRCSDCGVIHLLVKLHKGILLEDEKDIESARNKLLQKNSKL